MKTNLRPNPFYRLGFLSSLALILIAYQNCSYSGSFNSASVDSSGASTSNSSSLMGKFQVSLLSSDGSVVYSDSTPNSTLQFKAGTTYSLKLDVTGMPDGTTYSLVMKETSVASGTTTTLPLTAGINSFSVPSQGDYSWKVIATAPSGSASSTKYYQASVTCANPTFTANSLTPSAISVSSAEANSFTFSSSGVVASANGTAPYSCAWDPTGVGIVDSGFQDCGTPLTNFYVNNVSTRNIGLIVKDSCNTTYAVSKSLNLAYAVPAKPGNVFIFGQTSGASGAAATDPRTNNVTYLATNNSVAQPVNANYSLASGGSSGSFDIVAALNYNQASSVNFGMEIVVNGITDSINVAGMTGTISAASATIGGITFKTDQAGDQAPAMTFTGSQCTLSQQGAQVHFTAGTPCSGGTTGTNNHATVEVWGHYVCTGLSSSGETLNVSGDFDGMNTLVDNCIGGGGGGGGGIVPIKL